MMMRTVSILALTALALSACGSRTELRPRQGMTAVPKAEAAARAATPSELMKPSTQAKPDRRADLLVNSEERKPDPFDLPPGPNTGRPPQ